jgi:methionyl aminopeptidase
VDCGTLYKGYNGDSAYTFPVGEVDAETQKLLDVTKESLYRGIQAAVVGNRTGDIGHAVQTYAESFGFSVVRELEGHGIGKHLHESPGVPNYGRKGSGARLTDGMTICIEPMINSGVRSVYLAKNGWAVHTADHRKSAHFELTVVVRKGQAELLSTFDFIEGKC